MQRALLQSTRPENKEIVEKAIKLSGREDARCLLPRSFGSSSMRTHSAQSKKPAIPKGGKKKPGGVKKGKGSPEYKKKKK